MTFNEAKNKLDNLTENQIDKIQCKLAKLHSKFLQTDKEMADIIELVSMAFGLYTYKNN